MARWMLERMLATQPGPTVGAAILQWQAIDRVDEAATRKTGAPSKLFLLGVPAAEIGRAAAAIEKDGTPAPRAAFHELTESREIYLENAAGSSDSNARRALLSKQNFVADYQAVGGQGKPQPV